MSRSIHTTHRDYERARRFKYDSPEIRTKRLKRIADDLRLKRRVKKAAIRSHNLRLPEQPIHPDAIPIRVLDEGEFVHYPASPEDIRGVMCRLPPGVLDGLDAIVLCLGKEIHEEEYGDPIDPDKNDRDPFVGRIGCQTLPGIWEGYSNGVWYILRGKAKIEIYAQVYNPVEMGERDIWELALRFRMLCVLVHEIAHHRDFVDWTSRDGCQRSEFRSEGYADKLAVQWAKDCVMPYMEERYPEMWAHLNYLTQECCGVSLSSLGHLLSWRVQGPGTGIFGDSWDDYFEALTAGGDTRHLTKTRLEFAKDLHYREVYGLSMEIIEGVLNENPSNAEALVLKADIYVHQGKLSEAEAITRQVLEKNPWNEEAWWFLQLSLRHRSSWRQLVESSTEALHYCQDDKWRQDFLENLVTASLYLGNYEEMVTDISRMTDEDAAFAFRSLGYLWSGNYQEAMKSTSGGLERKRAKRFRWRSVLKAVRFEAAHRLGRPEDAGTMSMDIVESVRTAGFNDWMERFVEEFRFKTAQF